VCRQVFPEAVALSNSTADWLERAGGQAVDVDNIAQRITVDVIGEWTCLLSGCNFLIGSD